MKFVKYLFISLAIVLLLLILAPFMFKGKIVALVKEQANANMNALMNFDEDISLSLIKSFPNLSVGIKNLSISGVGDFDGDTLYSAASTDLTLDIISVIKGAQIQIRQITLDQPRIKALVLSDGRANWDITKADTSAGAEPVDTSASKFNIKLKSFEIKNGYIVYDDKEGDMFSELKGMNYTLEGDFNEVLFTLQNKASIESLTFGMEGLNYLSHVKATANANIDADMNNFKFVFKDNVFTLNELSMGMNGSFAMPGDDMEMDITYEVQQSEFRNFLSLIPALYTNDFKDLQSKGKLAFKGFVKGIYNDKQMPAFGLNLAINDGYFKYPALPSAVENVAVKLDVNNPDGYMDHTEINLSKMHVEIQGDAFDAKLLAKTPMSDPYIDAFVKGILNLDNITKIVPLPEGTTLHGIIKSDLTAKGNISTLEKGNYEAFEAAGNLICEKIYYAASDLPKPFELAHTELNFSPKQITLKDFDAKIGGSDMQMNGTLSNFFPYYFGKGALVGSLNFNSNLFDANEFLTDDETAKTEPAAEDTAAMTVFEVPKDIQFTLNSNIKQLKYTNMDITQFVGTIEVANQQMTFKNIALNLLGSNMKMDGFYETRNPKKPNVDINFTLNNLDIQQAFKTFNTVKKLAPAAENVFGSFSTTFKMKTALTEHMQPDYATLLADGLLSVPSAEVKNIQALNKISDAIQKPEYKKAGLYNAKIAFTVENGKINTQPFDVKLGTQTLNLSGSTGLDQSINYTGKMNIPRSDLGNADKAMQDALALLNQKAGSNIKTNDMIPVQIGIGGTFTAPKITTNIGALAKNEASNLTDQAKAEALRKKQELEAQARAEADRLKKEAETKARAEADRLKKEAETKAKAEADRLKKEAEAKAKTEAEKLKEEAKKKIKGLLK
jgi:hypothetical protein